MPYEPVHPLVKENCNNHVVRQIKTAFRDGERDFKGNSIEFL